MAKRKLLNVRAQLEHLIFTVDDMLERAGKHPTGLQLPPIDEENLRKMRLLAKATLAKHSHTRKDVRL
jgi:hypothetical protein